MSAINRCLLPDERPPADFFFCIDTSAMPLTGWRDACRRSNLANNLDRATWIARLAEVVPHWDADGAAGESGGLLEGMEENGSDGLHALVVKAKDAWFMKGSKRVCRRSHIACVDSCTSNWPRALRANLQCGVFGRTVHEPITNLTARLVDPAGNILVPGVDDMIFITYAEVRALYDKLDYSIADVNSALAAGAPIALPANKTHVIMGPVHLSSLALSALTCEKPPPSSPDIR
ncbi:hypothetical protein B0H11DRAFT_2225705 [Mycena galericulata]|nr:hypothetical protein B0H11DRAFT_2225705 [Mycena galericulata]